MISLVIAAAGANAQSVRIEISSQSDRYVPGEPIPVAIKISNLSGRTLVFGKDKNWLNFEVRSKSRSYVQQRTPVSALGEFQLPNGRAAEKQIDDLSKFFELQQADRYVVSAIVQMRELGRAEMSREPLTIDVINPAIVWEQDFGMHVFNANQPPETRRYAVQKLSTIDDNVQLFVRASDPSGRKIFGLARLGKVVISDPKILSDRLNRLHIVHQFRARLFQYTVLSPKADILKRHTYDGFGFLPGLIMDESGNVNITGGARRINKNDIPAEKLEQPETTTQAPK